MQFAWHYVCLTGRIVAIISPDCQRKPGQRLCWLAVSSTVVSFWVDKRLSTLPFLEWFVRCEREPIPVPGSSEPWRIAIFYISNHSSHPGVSGNFGAVFPNHWLVIQGEFKKDGRHSSLSIQQKARMHVQLQAVIIKRERGDVGVDYCADLQKDQLYITLDICVAKVLLQS